MTGLRVPPKGRSYATGDPRTSCSQMAVRWGLSKATVCRLLAKLEEQGYITTIKCTGSQGTVIYLRDYLSTMFIPSTRRRSHWIYLFVLKVLPYLRRNLPFQSRASKNCLQNCLKSCHSKALAAVAAKKEVLSYIDYPLVVIRIIWRSIVVADESAKRNTALFSSYIWNLDKPVENLLKHVDNDKKKRTVKLNES